MQFSQALNLRRIARWLTSVLVLTLLETVAAPIIAPGISTPQSQAVSGTFTAASSTSRSYITIPAGVESITLTITGGGGGKGGIDGDKAGGKGGMAQRVVASFAVTPGDVIALFPGNAGSNGTDGANINSGGTGVGGAVAGGASTVTDSYWNVNGTSYQNPSFSGGGGGKVGASGGSGSGGGGGAASVVAINRNIVAIAGGAGGGGGAGNSTGAQGTDGVDANTPNSNLMYGGVGKDSGAGTNCSASDGGGGGGGGGGYLAGTGGSTELVGSECSGRGGFRGNALVYNALSSTVNSFDTSATPGSPLAGTITYSYDVKSPTVCAPTTTTVDIYTVLKFDASINCTWTVPSTVSVIDIFAIGGGGGGGDDGGTGGGGGAGLSRSAVPVTPSSSVTVRVGYGGRAGNFNAWSSDFGETSSVTTTASTFNAPGGQGGGNRATGKGAGGSAAVNGTFAGGAGGAYPSSGAVGSAGNFGISNYFFGTQNTYAGGGGGGCYYETGSNVNGAAGRNGGGAGCSNTFASGQIDGIAGTAGTGGGGGGGGAGAAGRVMGGKGGSGVILIRYATNAEDAFPSSVASALSARWLGTDFQYLDSARRGWMDSSGTNSSTRVLSGSTTQIVDAPAANGSTKTFKTLQGATTDEITLADLPTNYTLFNVARYNNGSKGRLITTSSGNWLSGFYQGATGTTHHNWWMTPGSGVVSNSDNWLLSSDQLRNYRANGRDVTYNQDAQPNGQYWFNYVSTSTGFGINNSNYAEKSDWQVADVIVFNRQLSNGETRAIERYLARIYGLTLDPIGQSGETDTALSLDGNQYFYTQLGFGNTINDTFTIEAWVNPSSQCGAGGGVRCTIFSKEYAVRATIYDGKFGFIMYGTSTVWEWNDTSLKIPINEWHHIALVKRGVANSNGAVEVYLDGQLALVKAGSPYVLSTANATFNSANILRQNDDQWIYVGAALGSYDRFRGQLDEVKVWKAARTSSEITQDMHSPDASNPSLQFYWDFNKSVGSKTENISNLGYGGGPRADLLTVGTANYVDVKTTITTAPYTTITFPRTYITQYGGWKVPSGISQAQVAVVAGGGGGGGGYEGGGGGAGGFIETVTTIVPGNAYQVRVGTGGRGTTYPFIPTNGESSTAFGVTTLGGGSGTVEFNDGGTNVQYAPGSGGSGGGGSWAQNFTGASGTTGQGNKGGNSSLLAEAQCGSGNTVFVGGGGGGAATDGQDASCLKGGNGGAGKASTVLGATVAAGGGGSVRPHTRTINSTFQGLGGTGGGGNSAYTSGAAVGATGGATNGTYGTGSGGGAGYASDGYSGYGGNGGTGVVALRYITALKPAYTKPTNAYLNVGMTETFTTNVAVDSATVGLTRTFKWESTTPTSGGTYSTLKTGTGAANAAYSWVPSDTSTSGSGYLYRLTVTDSDTTGLFITDSSTAYAVINQALVVTFTSSSTSIAKKINVSRNETYTITLGTPTYRATLTPVIPGITIDTTTAGSVLLKIGDTTTVGTWLETLTVTDSVSASVVIPLTITIAAPPQLTESSEIVKNGLVFNIDASNTASFTPAASSINDISGSKEAISVQNGVSYASEYSGVMTFNPASTTNQYATATGFGQMNTLSIETYIRLNTTVAEHFCPLVSEYTGAQIGMALCIDAGRTWYFGFRSASAWTYKRAAAAIPLNTWTHLVGTFDGSALRIYINNSLVTSFDAANGQSTSGGLTPPTPTTSMAYINRTYTSAAATSPNASYGFIRLYNIGLTDTQVAQNYNATKFRFDSSNESQITPTKKYGALNLESFTATSGGETKTISFAVGNRAGVTWDTTTVPNQIKLSVQESLSAGTYYDTVTVTDNFGQSSYLPIKFTVTKADTLTISMDASSTVVYTGAQPASAPKARITGLVGVDSGTAVTSYKGSLTFGSTCATGGICNLGDTGPGGGIVFKVSTTETDTASGISSGGKYLEIAPILWDGNSNESAFKWATETTNIPGTVVSVGLGAENNRKVLAAIGSAATTISRVVNSTYNGVNDWFLPSSSELQELYNSPGLWTAAGMSTSRNYWTSTQDTTEGTTTQANTIWGGTGQIDAVLKTLQFYVRPIRAFSPVYQSITVPTEVETYTVTGKVNLSSGSLSNYVNVVYETSTLKITQANQNRLSINLYGAVAGMPFTIVVTGGSGTGAITETITAGSTATNCRVSSHILRNDNSATDQKACNIAVTKAASRNYKVESLTATVYFMTFVNNQPSNQVGSGSTIALNGQTSLTIDDSSTVRAPRIISFSLSGSTLTINGEGFGSTPVTITFERFVNASPSPTPTSAGSVITVPVPGGAVSGPVLVITAGGRDSIDWIDLP